MNCFKSKIPKWNGDYIEKDGITIPNTGINGSGQGLKKGTENRWYQNLKAENIIPSLHPIEEYAHEYKHQHKPWYMLTKNELKEIWKNRQMQPKKGKDYFDWIVEEKITKWERKHPKPSDDLFKEEFMLNWNKEREEELTRIRDVVVSQYDKTTRLVLIGRYKVDEGKYEEKQLGEVKDFNLQFEKTNKPHHLELAPEKSKTIKEARKKTNQEFKRNSSLVCTRLENKEQTKARVFTETYSTPLYPWQRPGWTKRWTKHGICA